MLLLFKTVNKANVSAAKHTLSIRQNTNFLQHRKLLCFMTLKMTP